MTAPRLGNGPDRFGPLTRLLHWLSAAAVLFLLGLGAYVARMDVTLSRLWLFGLHKTTGFLVLALTVIRVAWHLHSPPPAPLPDTPWRMAAARAVHRALYVLLLLIPLLGWAASSATGLDVVIFGRWTLPPIAPVSESWEAALFLVHRILAWTLAALVLVHVAGALTRQDGTLRRMLRGHR